MIFKYTIGGALISDEPIKGVTQEFKDEATIDYYGGKYFIAESMSKTCARRMAICFKASFEGEV